MEDNAFSFNDVGSCDLRYTPGDTFPHSLIVPRKDFAVGFHSPRIVACGGTADSNGAKLDTCEYLDLSVKPYAWAPSTATLMFIRIYHSYATASGKVWPI